MTGDEDEGVVASESICWTCDHLYGDHVTMTLKKDPKYGGVIICPVGGCMCATPWAVEGREAPPLPDVSTLLGMFQYVQQQYARRFGE